MADITLKGNPVKTIGELPLTGAKAKDFNLVANDLSNKSLADFKGKRILLNIFPSLDTGTCANSVRQFNKEVSQLENTVVLCISRDLPFAQSRFCGAEGIENVLTLSDFATGQFGIDYGLRITSGPLKDLNSRAVVILNENNEVVYTEQVSEIANEPNYKAAVKALS